MSSATSGLYELLDRRRVATWAVAIAILIVVFVAHRNSSVTQTDHDTQYALLVAQSLVSEGDADLDEYRAQISRTDYRVQFHNGHVLPLFPIGPSLCAVPFVAARTLLGPGPFRAIDAAYYAVEVSIACWIVALTAVVIFFIARESLATIPALLIVFIFSFGTSAWSTASRALWQHGPSMLLLSLGLLLMLAARRNPRLVQLAAIPLAFSYVVRPTNSIAIALFALYVLRCHRRYFLRYALWSVAVALPFFAFNAWEFGSPLPAYYLPNRIGANPAFFEALLGNLVSPGRGLLLYTPVLLLSLYGFLRSLKGHAVTHPENFLNVILAGVIVFHWLAISSFPHWWGGFSYGPRLFSDTLPFWLFFLIPVLSAPPRTIYTKSCASSRARSPDTPAAAERLYSLSGRQPPADLVLEHSPHQRRRGTSAAVGLVRCAIPKGYPPA